MLEVETMTNLQLSYRARYNLGTHNCGSSLHTTEWQQLAKPPNQYLYHFIGSSYNTEHTYLRTLSVTPFCGARPCPKNGHARRRPL